ncbi:phosphoglycerate mutase family protein [Cytobacillus sp. FSL W7-1323]|uniref:histidine phosphatase family protein n=1 Tax=Cytobacillus sp. FSL W7-1323 TaxID=2921700 RepID=UPI00315834A8
MVTTIYMVRHAESPFIFGEEKTRGLSPRGREAAIKVTEILKDKKIDRVISSPYTRAIETVREVAENRQLQIKTYENLRERPIKGLDYHAEEKELLSAIEQSFKDENLFSWRRIHSCRTRTFYSIHKRDFKQL